MSNKMLVSSLRTAMLLPFCVVLGMAPGAFSAEGVQMTTEKTSHAEDRKAVAVTIYNDSLALVREERNLALDAGRNSIALREVAAKIKPETASLHSNSGATLRLLEQNFDFDLLSPQKMIEKNIGRHVMVISVNPKDGTETREDALVLANNQDVVLKYADRIETGVPKDARLAYSDVPPDLRDQPTLVVDLESDQAGAQDVELSYLTGGMSWKADYVAALSDDEQTLDLAGWVTLTNQSGATYANAVLQLVAGDVNRVQEKVLMLREDDLDLKMSPASASMERQSLFEYHLYTLDRPTTLRDRQTKQVALLSAARVPVQKEYRIEGMRHHYFWDAWPAELGEKQNAEVFVEFENSGNDLGVPLPKGVMRVYKNDSRGSSLFVGEDEVAHTPKNEKIRLKLGKAFDVTASRKRTAFKRISKKVIEQQYTIEIANAKTAAATVKVVEPVPGDWKMQKESHPHQKGAADAAVWHIEVPAEGKVELEYRVQIREQ